MNIFYNSAKAFLPRIDAIYLQTRALALTTLVGWLALGFVPPDKRVLSEVILAAFVLHFISMLALTRNKKNHTNKLYLAAVILDSVAIFVWIGFASGFDSSFDSPFYVGLYLIVSFASYLLTRKAAIITTSLISIAYTAILWPELSTLHDWLSLSLRLSPCWVFMAVISHVAEHLHRSEGRMLNLFNTLNKRTSELEKIQAQLESIYDNSRILAGILDVNEVIKAVMQIVNSVLKYPSAALLMCQGETGFLYRGRVVDGEINLLLKSAPEESVELLHRVSKLGSPVSIPNILNRDDYTALRPDTRSVMMAPMTVRRKTLGILVAESTVTGAFSERDEKMFWVVARSAAMAIDNSLVHQEMEELTITDDLTGAFNYRYFTNKLEEEQRRASRYSQPLSLIMLDIDHFKKFNDTYGHESGNLILKELSRVAYSCVRDTDVFARYGGEEFAIILPQTSLSEAKQIASRIRESIEKTRFFLGEGIPRQTVTVSVGLTSFPENGKSHEDLIQLADQALYRAKGSGRNVVQVI